MEVRPADFDGTILVVAPHMDDETLGCGLLLASRPDKERLHVTFATDGSHSPARPSQTRGEALELAHVRETEALEALGILGVPAENARFLGLEDGSLRRFGPRLTAALTKQIQHLRPAFVFVPFRYDRHPDHLAVRAAVGAARRSGAIVATIVEYFVYSQWRLLSMRDVRKYVVQEYLRRIEAGAVSAIKRRALGCHRSQTTCLYAWQTRPILTTELIDRVCGEPETYLVCEPSLEGRRVLAQARTWLPIAHRAEPVLKRWKDRLSGWNRA